MEEVNGMCVVVVNSMAEDVKGFTSKGVVLFSKKFDHTIAELVRPPDGSAVGERCYLERNDAIDVTVRPPLLDPYERVIDKCFLYFSTDS